MAGSGLKSWAMLAWGRANDAASKSPAAIRFHPVRRLRMFPPACFGSLRPQTYQNRPGCPRVPQISRPSHIVTLRKGAHEGLASLVCLGSAFRRLFLGACQEKDRVNAEPQTCPLGVPPPGDVQACELK